MTILQTTPLLMIISFENSDERTSKIRSAFTVENKDIDRQQKIMKKDLSRQRYIKLYATTTDKTYFPIGQFNRMLEWDTAKSLQVGEFKYIANDKDVPTSMLAEQREILLDMLMDGTHTGIVNMKTGRGKGNMILQLIGMYQQKTLILCHNIKTVLDMIDKFKKFTNYEPGVYYSKKKLIKDITITTHASFVQKQKLFRSQFGLILYDECDYNLSSDMMNALIFSDAEGLIGFTGTPKTKSLSLQDLSLIYGNVYRSQHTLDTGGMNGYNILPSVTRILYTQGEAFSFDKRHELRDQMSADKKRLQAQVDFVKNTYKDNNLSLLLIDRVNDCDQYLESLTTQGIPCRVINGLTKPKDDEQSIADMLSQQGVIIGTYHKIGRGVDIPPIDCIYFFFPNSFDSTAIQAVGRSLRSFPGKETVHLYDWNDTPILKGQGSKRLQVYKTEYKQKAEDIKEIII